MKPIVVENLSRRFGKLKVLESLSFSVEEGERVAIVGNNGAGKTTLLRILTTFLPASSGIARVCGFDIFRDGDLVREHIGYLSENIPLYEEMRVSDYLKFKANLRQMPKRLRKERMHEVIDVCDLSMYRFCPISILSQGIKQRVAIADAILHEPNVLLLDSLFSACDPYQTETLINLLVNDGVAGKRTIVFTGHNRDVIASLATRVLFLYSGRIIGETRDMDLLRKHSLSELFDNWLSEMPEDR